MGCVGVGLAFLLALAVPASIAHSSLVGAVVVIVLIAACSVAAVLVRARRRPADGPEQAERSTRPAMVSIALLTVAYLAVVTVIHAA